MELHMTTLTVTSKGQVTLRKDVLKHLGIKPCDKLAVDLLPAGKATLSAVKTNDDLDGFFGLLHDPSQRAMSIEEMNEIIADGWAGER
jgi:antitoxin PrlF